MSTRSARRSAEQWFGLISQFQASGESAEDFCRTRSLVPSTFERWRGRYAGVRRRRRSRQEPGPGFVPVLTPLRLAGVVVQVGSDVRIECPAQMDIDTLAQLVRAVRDGR